MPFICTAWLIWYPSLEQYCGHNFNKWISHRIVSEESNYLVGEG